MAAHWARVRPLAAALGAAAAGGLAARQPVLNDAPPKKDFVTLKVLKNEQHTRDTRKITMGGLVLGQEPVVNVAVRAPLGGSSCCGCCKCGPNCACPKKPSGCCGCCSCPEPCRCPRGKGGNVVRMYNPIALRGDGTLTLLVKKYEGAQMGSHLHGLKKGDTIEVKGPNRQWEFQPGKYKEYAMVAGGTGITPLIQATTHILKHDTAKVTMVCANKSGADMLLTEELDMLEKAFPDRLKVVRLAEDQVGQVTSKDHLKNALPPPSSSVLVMVCGRPPMAAAVAGPKTKDFKQGEVGGVLKDLGYSSDQVWKM